MKLQFPIRNSGVNRVKTGIYNTVIVIIIGGVFISVGVFMIDNLKVDNSWIRVNGEIVDTNVYTSNRDGRTYYNYAPIVEFSAQGQKYRATTNYSSPHEPKVGDIREVAYNPSNPNNSVVVNGGGVGLFILLFPTIGTLLIIYVVYSLIKDRKRDKKIAELVNQGVKLQGILTNIKTASSRNNIKTYKIIVSVVDGQGNTRQYNSDTISSIGGLLGVDPLQTPIPIDVYVSRLNPDNYYVDLSDVPSLDADRIQNLLNKAKNRIT